MKTKEYEFNYEDVVYLAHPGGELLARIYTPVGDGPFPAIVELHGGAWSKFDRTRGEALHQAFAKAGIVVVALDFRQGEEGAYPKSVADINYGIRWLKANAEKLKVDPERVGLSGNSSGGHLGMLVAMRPDDPRYSEIQLPDASPSVDASVRFVSMLWPVINPYGRYQHAKRLLDSDSPPEWAARIVKMQDAYWKTTEAMKEANPMLMLERKEKVHLPPAFWLSVKNDDVHNYRDIESDVPGTEADRFALRYGEAGGNIELLVWDAEKMFTVVHPTLPSTVEAMNRVVAFAKKHLDA
ncbi:alpha/beta hydrolase [Advenella sp. RU8]|uniref:alpha/beta hydrolase n=1 Tax=Advenella sp. RU8 TaxID=3399575 RepID=UPI003AAF0CB4